MSNTAENPSSTKPYLVRALYEWCTDNGLTPYLAAQVDGQVKVPREHVKNGEIVLNISFGATTGLKIGHDDVRFKARFGGIARDIVVPMSHVTAIYARENGQGMAFPAPEPVPHSDDVDAQTETTESLENAKAHPDSPASRLHAVPDRTRSVPPDTLQPAPSSEEPGEEPPPEPPPRSTGSHLKRVK